MKSLRFAVGAFYFLLFIIFFRSPISPTRAIGREYVNYPIPEA